MATLIGRKITADSIVFHIDFSNRKCFAPNLLNYSTWTVGSGGVGGDANKWGQTAYSLSGGATENVRVLGTDPFGYTTSVVWKGYSLDAAQSSPDGGFNTGWVNIDPKKMYRFSVWTKRDNMTVGGPTSGQFYLGFIGAESTNQHNLTSKNNYTEPSPNPYFHVTPNPNISSLSSVNPPFLGGIDTWTLVTGHVWPAGSQKGVIVPGSAVGSLQQNYAHPDSGVWTRTNGKVGNLLYSTSLGSGYTDWIWNATSSYTFHRAYHYYSADSTATQSFIYPRIDVVDGLEPTISELLSGPEPVRDMSPNMNVIYPFSTTNFDKNGKGMIFSNIQEEIIGGPISKTFSVYSMSVWFKPTNTITGGSPGSPGSPARAIVQFNTGWTPFILYLGEISGAISSEVITVTNGAGTFTTVSNISIQGGIWHNITISWNGTKYLIYLNGILQTTTTGLGIDAPLLTTVNHAYIGGRYSLNDSSWGCFFDGNMGSIVVYNKSLTQTDIIEDYNAMSDKYTG